MLLCLPGAIVSRWSLPSAQMLIANVWFQAWEIHFYVVVSGFCQLRICGFSLLLMLIYVHISRKGGTPVNSGWLSVEFKSADCSVGRCLQIVVWGVSFLWIVSVALGAALTQSLFSKFDPPPPITCSHGGTGFQDRHDGFATFSTLPDHWRCPAIQTSGTLRNTDLATQENPQTQFRGWIAPSGLPFAGLSAASRVCLGMNTRLENSSTQIRLHAVLVHSSS